jgi:hypothetical protein
MTELCDAQWILLRFSKITLILILFIYGGALLSLWISSLWILAKIMLMSFLVIHFVIVIRRNILLSSSDSIVSLRFDGHHWQLQKKSGNNSLTELLPSTIPTPYFLLLHFKDVLNRRFYFVPIFLDTLPPDSFRHLQAILGMASSV